MASSFSKLLQLSYPLLSFLSSFSFLFLFFFFLLTCQYSRALLIPVGCTDPAPALSFYWGTDVSQVGLQPGSRSLLMNWRGEQNTANSGTVLSSIIGAQKTSGFGKEQMSLSLLICLWDVRPPVHHTLKVYLITELPNNKRLKENPTLVAFPYSFPTLQDWLAGFKSGKFLYL